MSSLIATSSICRSRSFLTGTVMLKGIPCAIVPKTSKNDRAAKVCVRAGKGFLDIFSKSDDAKVGDRKRLKPGKVSPPLVVPSHIPRPSYADTGVPPPWNESPQIHGKKGIQKMRAAGKLAAQVRDYAGTLVKVGITTDEIDKAVHKAIIDAGAYPSPLNYGKFPKSVCTSVNECICHGIPDDRALEDGDIINIDVTVFLDGYHGDTSATFQVGTVAPEAIKLIDVTRESLNRAIAICRPGAPYRLIGEEIQKLADANGFGTVKNYVGHGIGQTFHSGPTIQHFRNKASGVMLPFQTFTIEPMLVMKPNHREIVWADDWTVVTADGSLSAQFEHTLLITDDGVEILTTP
eukprot:jgi/Mesvir1/6875/Mv09043-RA.1